MKTCLIYQPVGLGDILWIQKIVDVIIDDGYQVFFPVEDVYFDMVSTSITKTNLFWVRVSDEFPLKKFFGTSSVHQTENELYLPISFADRYFPQCSVMLSKYYFLDVALSDYRKHFEITRNYGREKKLIDTYALKNEFVLVNKSFGTNPRQREFDYKSDKLTHVMNIDEDKKNGFNLFDWIGAIEQASEIHTVETSLCYLVDKYATTEKLYMYEKRVNEEANTYYRNVSLVYRNPNWTYGN
jgi:hypothetical protein